MKKEYIKPEMISFIVDIPLNLCNVSTEGANVNAGYGGVDSSGSLSPSAPRRRSNDNLTEDEDFDINVLMDDKEYWSEGMW